MAPQVPDLIFSKYLSICPQVNIFDFLSGHVMLEKYQNFVARHWTPTSALASLKVATAIEIASSAAESILPGPKYINIAKTIQSAPMPDPTRLVPVTQIAEQVISTCKVDILSTYAVILLFIFLMTIIVLLLIIIALIVTGHTRAKFPNSSPLPLDMPTSHLSVSSTPVSTLGADHHDNPSSPDPLPFPVMAISESPLRSMEWMILMLCLIEIKQCKQDRLQFDKRMTEAFDLFKQALRLSDFEDVVDGQVSANVDNVQDTYVEASPTPAVVSIVTFEDASGSSHLLESAPSTLERSPFRAPTLLVDLAVPSVSVELEREVSTSIASTEIVLEETSVTDDLPKSTLSILNQLPFHSPSPLLSPLIADMILQYSPSNTSSTLSTEISNSVTSTASVPGTDSDVLSGSMSSVVSSSPKSLVDQILPFALAEETSTNTAVLADSPVKEDSSDSDPRVIVADSDTLSSSRPSTTPVAVTCSSPIDMPITKSKEDGTAVNESLYHLVLEVSNDLPGALFAAPEVSVLEDFGTKSIVTDDSLILDTLTSAQTQELSASQSDDRTSGLLLAGPSQLLQVPIASPITTPILETSSKTSLPAILSDPPPKRRSRSSSFPPRRSSLPSSRQSRCLSSSGPYRSPFIAAVLPQSEFTFSAPVPDKALHAPVADCTVLDVSPPLKFSFSSFSSSSLSPETSFTFTFTPPSTATISASEGVVEVLDAPPSSIPTPLPIYTPPTSLPPFPLFHLSPSTPLNFSADSSASLDQLYAPAAPAPLSRRKSTRLQSRRASILPYSSVANADAISTVSLFPAPSSLGYPLTATTLEVTKSELDCPNSEETKHVANIEAAPTMPEFKSVYNVSEPIHHVDDHTNTITEEPSTESTASTSTSTSTSTSHSTSSSLQPEVISKTPNFALGPSSESEVTPLMSANHNNSLTTLSGLSTSHEEHSTTQDNHPPRRPASRRARKSKKSKTSKK